jgi:type II secretory pathway component GspD/PulD (secretin)
MTKKIALAAIIAGLFVAWMAPSGFAINSDYAQDVSIQSDPSPRDTVTGSSVNQYGAGQTNSQIDNYLNQDEQINLDAASGQLRVLRTNQKAVLNDYVTTLVPLQNASPRELRGLARTLCRKEGGDADVLQDKVSKKNYLVIVCPQFQVPYVTSTLQALDKEWIKEVNDGSLRYYYKARNRDARAVERTMSFHKSPDSLREFDDPNNAILFFDQPCLEGLIKWGTETADIPPNQITLDVAVYEVDTQNDLELGFDFESWKNGPGRNLFDFVYWDYNGNDPLDLYPGSAPFGVADHGHYRSYNVDISLAYVDFLQCKGKARLMNKTNLLVKSGTVGQISAADEIATFVTDIVVHPEQLPTDVEYDIYEIYDYYHDRLGNDLPGVDELVTLPPATVVNYVDTVLASISVSANDRDAVRNELTERGEDGTIDSGDLHDTGVNVGIMLQVFRDRTVNYRKAANMTGLLMSVYPVVGQESAEMAISLDVSEMNDLTPTGAPIIEHRYYASALQLKNGQPLVLGGLKKSSKVTSANGMPFLRDIKYLGYLFGHELTTKREREVLVVVTPHFRFCPTNDAEPPVELATAMKVVKGEEELQVPKNAYGFDQWLLDKDKE